MHGNDEYIEGKNQNKASVKENETWCLIQMHKKLHDRLTNVSIDHCELVLSSELTLKNKKET